MKRKKISGIIVALVGLVLIIISLWKLYFLLIYGIPLFIIGLIIIFNKNEDEIEQIKQKGGKK